MDSIKKEAITKTSKFIFLGLITLLVLITLSTQVLSDQNMTNSTSNETNINSTINSTISINSTATATNSTNLTIQQTQQQQEPIDFSTGDYWLDISIPFYPILITVNEKETIQHYKYIIDFSKPNSTANDTTYQINGIRFYFIIVTLMTITVLWIARSIAKAATS